MDLKDMALQYHEQLLGSKDGMEYYRTFDLSDATIEEFKLGWVQEPLLPRHSSIVESAVVPYWSVGERVMAIRHDPFLYDEVGNYDSGWVASAYPLSDTNKHLFNVRHALAGLRTPETFLVSDVLSALHLRQRHRRVVAVPGYQNWHWPWTELFLSADLVMVMSENESDAGDDLLQKFKRRQINVRTVLLSSGDRAHYHLSGTGTVEQMLERFGGI